MSVFLLAISGITFAYAPTKSEVCKSDVKGFCTYTTPREQVGNNLKNGRELAAEAQSFVVPGIEFLGISGNATLGDVLVQLYKYLLGLVGLSSLLMLIWGGFEYATATDKGVGDAKKKIGNALFGLALALIAYLGLVTINPDFIKKLDLNLHEITMGPAAKSTCIQGAYCTDPLGSTCLGAQVCASDGGYSDCVVDRSSPECQPKQGSTCTVRFTCPGETETRSENIRMGSPDVCNQLCTKANLENSGRVGRSCPGEAVNPNITSTACISI